MQKPDYAHRVTDKELARLEKRIAKVYTEAAADLDRTITAYFEQFAARDAEQKARVEAGEITEQYYQQWRLNQMGRGERFQAMRDKVAQRATEANEVARSYVQDMTPGVYSLNRNYTAYEIDKMTGQIHADWTLFDEQTVKRLVVENPDVMPYYSPTKALNRGIDLKYGKQQITKSVTSSIIQGKGIKGISDDLQERITDMNRNSAIRTARTAVTAAQNAGRMDSYAAAENMGIGLKKRWLATLDGRTRHAHRELDGHKPIPYDEPFKVDGYEIMYPGDPAAEAYLVYNCRCTLVAEVEGVDTSYAKRRARDPETGEREIVSNMTYNEWMAEKRGQKVVDISSAGDKIESEKPLSIYQQYEKNVEAIKTALHGVEEERRSLDYEVGTIIDKSGNVINVTGGEEHSVSPPDDLLPDNIFTHNHPSGGCFSAQDLESMIDSRLLELRASTPQGTFFSLLRTEAADLTSHEFSDQFKKETGYTKAADAITKDMKAGIITRKELEKKGFQVYVDYMSKLAVDWLDGNAEKFGYIFTQGVI